MLNEIGLIFTRHFSSFKLKKRTHLGLKRKKDKEKRLYRTRFLAALPQPYPDQYRFDRKFVYASSEIRNIHFITHFIRSRLFLKIYTYIFCSDYFLFLAFVSEKGLFLTYLYPTPSPGISFSAPFFSLVRDQHYRHDGAANLKFRDKESRVTKSENFEKLCRNRKSWVTKSENFEKFYGNREGLDDKIKFGIIMEKLEKFSENLNNSWAILRMIWKFEENFDTEKFGRNYWKNFANHWSDPQQVFKSVPNVSKTSSGFLHNFSQTLWSFPTISHTFSQNCLENFTSFHQNGLKFCRKRSYVYLKFV